MARGWREEFLIVVQLNITFSVTDLPMFLLCTLHIQNHHTVARLMFLNFYEHQLFYYILRALH